MLKSRHLLLLACTHALSCATRPELARPQPATQNLPHWDLEAELRKTPPSAGSISLSNPYAPTRSGPAGVYSWQSQKSGQCATGPAAAKPGLARTEARGMMAAFPEATADATDRTQPFSADLVVASLRPAIHHCFSRWLETKLDARGSVRMAIELGCAGDVQAILAENQGVDQSTLSCLFSAVAPARFAPPVGGHATVLVPVVFKNSAR